MASQKKNGKIFANKMKSKDTRPRCPICGVLFTKKNPPVNYHLRYPIEKYSANWVYKKPYNSGKEWTGELAIIACKFCNFTEYALRNNKPLPRCAVASRYPQDTLSRADKVIKFHYKLGLKI